MTYRRESKVEETLQKTEDKHEVNVGNEIVKSAILEREYCEMLREIYRCERVRRIYVQTTYLGR